MPNSRVALASLWAPLKVGDMVDVKLLDVDFDKKRISLSMKALLNDDAE